VPPEQVYRYVLRTDPPGRGRVVFGLGRQDPRMPYIVRVVLTLRGHTVACVDEEALRRAQGCFTPRRLDAMRRSRPAAEEAVRRFGARDVLVEGRFTTDRERFRPQCTHPVLHLRPTGADGAGRLGSLDLGEAYVILEGDQVACRGLLLTFADFPGICEVSNVRTEPRFRRRGMARSVVSRMTADALERGAAPVFTCSLGNAASVRICRSLGYRRFAVEVIGLAE